MQAVVGTIAYFERYAAFAGRPEFGHLQWAIVSALQDGWYGRMDQVMGVLDLMAAAIDQASLDGERWGLASLFLLLRDPPAHDISRRETNSFARPFVRLAEQGTGHDCIRLFQRACPHRAAPLRPAQPSGASKEPSRCPGSRRRRGTSSSKSEAEGKGKVSWVRATPSLPRFFASCCTRWVLRARTPFSQYVQNSLLATECAGRASPSHCRSFVCCGQWLSGAPVAVIGVAVPLTPEAFQMFSNLVVIALNFVAGELRLLPPAAALGRPLPSRDQAACLKRVVKLTRLWCRDAGETRVDGRRSGPAMETGMQDLIQSLAPIRICLDPYFFLPSSLSPSFSRCTCAHRCDQAGPSCTAAPC